MAIKNTLEIINRMKADGVIGDFAIGGAVGALLYIEAASTEDVDVFVDLPAAADSKLISLTPIYEYLTARGCKTRGEYIDVGDWPVQFLPASTPLLREALERASEVDVEGTKTRVMKPEHLAAIAIDIGRIKDHARLLQFVEQGALDTAKLDDVIVRHGLVSKWQALKKRLL